MIFCFLLTSSFGLFHVLCSFQTSMCIFIKTNCQRLLTTRTPLNCFLPETHRKHHRTQKTKPNQFSKTYVVNSLRFKMVNGITESRLGFVGSLGTEANVSLLYSLPSFYSHYMGGSIPFILRYPSGSQRKFIFYLFI